LQTKYCITRTGGVHRFGHDILSVIVKAEFDRKMLSFAGCQQVIHENVFHEFQQQRLFAWIGVLVNIAAMFLSLRILEHSFVPEVHHLRPLNRIVIMLAT
jgi:hypothetical protein